MRILLVTPYYIPAWGFGGPVKVVSDLTMAFQKRSHQVTVATTDVLDQRHRITKSFDTVNGIPVYYFPNVSTTAAFRWNMYFPRGFRAWLQQHIHEFDVVHCHDFYTSLNTSVSRVAKEAGVPYVVQPHGALIPIRQATKFSSIKRLWLALHANVIRDADAIIASTLKEQEEIHQFQNVELARIPVIPNGLDSENLGRPKADDTTRQKLGIKPDEHVILYFGRIQYIKGVDISLKSLALLHDVQWKYIVVGRDDGQQASLETLTQSLGLRDRVRFVGPKFGQELDELFGISDLFLFNSRSESFPISVLNACAAGLPLVLSPECRVPEVEELGAGVVLPENSPIETAKTLRQLLPDTQRRRTMSLAGPRLIKDKFSLDLVVEQYISLYSSIIKTV